MTEQKNVFRVGVGGSACDPPHLGQKALLEVVVASCLVDQMVWVPSGVRKDKPGLTNSRDRAFMARLAMDNSSLGSDCVFWGDIHGRNTPTIKLIKRVGSFFGALGRNVEMLWFTGVDVLVPRSHSGRCEMQDWVEGERLMREQKFIVLPRQGCPHPRELNLPENFVILDAELPDISSSDIRRRIATGEPFEHLVVPEVADYIKQKHLYGWKGER